MNIDWDKIKKECPKGYKKFINTKHILLKISCWDLKVLCYCDIEKFFDINIGINKLNFEFGSLQRRFMNPGDEDAINIKETLREQAIYEAFEILEKDLNE